MFVYRNKITIFVENKMSSLKYNDKWSDSSTG